MAKFDYDELSDSLFVSCKKPNEKVKGSAEIGDFIFDFTNEGRVVSVEVRGISSYLELLGVNTEILDKLTNVELKIIIKGNSFLAFMLLKTPNVEQKVTLGPIPTRRPMLA